ncbi:lipoprotein insertase outer membrane protein LolB [Moraxella nasicaprae]|uniref:Outer-membrane lipoprotein LolB n=1 Tax=Moraxella nasicaprae TaxID=2904122 RepID=A0ABY6F289_9GAMM|nr:lipoprotein insertase outer membrane protein LolB [Moraxella nasicaprae]UXZ04203.1 lipoprotein insertase outer membrane protein LolB [Moraxella nasicaprae]
MKNIRLILTACALTGVLTACQSVPNTPIAQTTALPNAPIKFTTTGKIGITAKTADGTQGGSAFYAWAQEGERFSIDLTGALGIGATQIRYNGTTATLESERTGLIEADSPEELLLSATGWYAPISQLPYWIVGRNAPSDDSKTLDTNGRLTTASNTGWTANFEYDKHQRPSRLRITHQDGHRVVMTITHQ